MITVDGRQGSIELVPYLKALKIPTTTAHLDFGDFSFLGQGPEGVPLLIGIERKTLGDFVASMRTGRLSGHQLPGLTASYSRVYLIIEGIIRPDVDGAVYTVNNKGRWVPPPGPDLTFAEIDHFLMTLEERAGVRLRFTADILSTAHTLATLHNWWTSKEYEAHRAHLAFHTVGPLAFRKPSLVARVAKELSGIGAERARQVAQAFPNLLEMVHATEDAWKAIDGIGAKLAARVYNEIRGRKV